MTVEDGTAFGEGSLAAVPRQILAFFDHVTAGMAFVAGALFIVLSFYITLDVLGRKFFHLSTAVSDEYAGYALALGGMWALAYTLRTGGHVRIDILLPYLPRTLRAVLDYGALAGMALFAWMIAFYVWRLAIDSFAMDARAVSFVRTPLFAPQGLMALGFTMLGLEAIVIFAVGVLESIRLGRLAPLEIQGGGEAGGPQEGPTSL